MAELDSLKGYQGRILVKAQSRCSEVASILEEPVQWDNCQGQQQQAVTGEMYRYCTTAALQLNASAQLGKSHLTQSRDAE